MEFSKEARTAHIKKVGKPFHYKTGHVPSTNRKMQKGSKHYAWKGEKVGYRGLHYWLRRVKGEPTACTKCGEAQRKTQWANIDGNYRRKPDDYVAMCSSCHKLHDLNLKAIRGTSSASL